jgi:O-antigen/teichoic acid export membrane protein
LPNRPLVYLLNGLLTKNLALADQAFVSCMNFVTGLLLARFLGIEAYGEYILVYGVMAFFSTVQLALIVSPMMVKGLLVPHDEQPAYFSAVMVQQLLFCLATALTIVIGGLMTARFSRQAHLGRLVIPLACATTAFITQDYFRRYFFVVKRPIAALINDILSYGLQVLLVLWFGLYKKLDTGTVLQLLCLAFCLPILVAFVQIWKEIRIHVSDKDFFLRTSIDSLHFGKWLLGVSVLYWVQGQLVNYLSAGMLSLSIVGAINACKNLLGPLNVFFLGLQNILLPESTRSYENGGIKGLGGYLMRVSFWGGGLTVAIVIVASIWSETWIGLLYGKAYHGYGWIVIWWGIYSILSFFQRPLTAGLSVLDRTRGVFNAVLIGSALFVALGYAFARKWQVDGIMFAMCFSSLVTVAGLSRGYLRWTRTAARA